jgi:hypothetical protein
MAHDDERQERDDFEPTIRRPNPERVERDTTPTDPEEHSLDIGDGADPRVEQPGG